MSYLLVDFCEDARLILEANDNPAGREQIRQKLELLLVDADFCAAHLGPENEPGMQQIYQDDASEFCVLAYNMTEPRESPPHDHGESWAVYGQVAGYTDMTIWTVADDGTVTPGRRFRLDPGEAGLFDVRAIHSINYGAGARFVRVTGVDMSGEARRVFDPESGAVREIAGVGTG